MDAFGKIQAKPLDSSTALSPIYQGQKEFSLYHESLGEEIGTVRVAPYGKKFIQLDLSEETPEMPETELYLAMEHAEEAINNFYCRSFPSMNAETGSNLGLVEKAEQILKGEQERNPGMYEF